MCPPIDQHSRSVSTSRYRSLAAILVKDSHYGAMFLVSNPTHNAVVSFDSRKMPAYYFRSFMTLEEAQSAFNGSLAQSRDNGWSIAWSGQPAYG